MKPEETNSKPITPGVALGWAFVAVIIAILAQVLGQIIYPDRTPLYQTIVGLATMTLAGYVGSLVAKWLKKSIWG